MNEYKVIGRLGNDPEVRHLENGSRVATFSLATNEDYTDKEGNRVKRTEWHNIVAWNNRADVCEKYLKKGSQAYFSGKHATRMYEVDGVKKYVSELLVNHMELLGSSGNSSGGGYTPQNVDQQHKSTEVPPGHTEIDDLPF